MVWFLSGSQAREAIGEAADFGPLASDVWIRFSIHDPEACDAIRKILPGAVLEALIQEKQTVRPNHLEANAYTRYTRAGGSL